ncbi:MAG: 23S rRNA pseudouridine synthase F, partial [Anaerolineae bacterium]
GLKRQIRRMLEHFDHHVFRLIRVRVGNLRLGRLTPGQGRWLDEGEIKALRKLAGMEVSQVETKGKSSEEDNDRNRRPGSLRQEHRRRRPRS